MSKKLTAAALVDFAKFLRDGEKSAATVEKYLRDASAFRDALGGAAPTKEAVLAYRQGLTQAGYAPSSVNAALSGVNSLLSFLGRRDMKVKTLRVQKQLYCPEEKELTRQEYFRLVSEAKRRDNGRLAMLLQTICATGIRVSELRFITVEAVAAGRAVVTNKGKTRTVFLPGKLQKKLGFYIQTKKIASGPVFVTRTGRPLDRSNIWREMKALCESAQVAPPKVFPHNLRHLFARCFYSIDKDIAKLADILGHSSIDTTRIYIVSTGAEHRRKLEKLCLLL